MIRIRIKDKIIAVGTVVSKENSEMFLETKNRRIYLKDIISIEIDKKE